MSSATDPSFPTGTGGSPDVEERLRRAYQELSFHVANTPLAVIEWDRDFRVSRWTGQAEAVFGWSASEVLGKRPFDWPFVHEADGETVSDIMAQLTDRQVIRNVVVNRNYTKAGAAIWCEWHNSVLLGEDGRLVSVLSLVLDVTERKAAAEALTRSEARLRAALRSALMMGWDWELTTRQSYFTTDYATFYGLPRDRDYTAVENAWLAVHPDDVARVDEILRRAVPAGENLDFEYRGRIPRSDGETRWFVTRGQVLPGPDGSPARVVAVTTDITDRKRAERERAALDRQLLDAQKWESLGVLAGGVAHDFNNILTVILGGAGLARRALPAGSVAETFLDQVEDAARRAADLCRQMLVYAGRGPASIGRTNLNRLIRDAAPLLEVPVARRARIHYDLAAELPVTPADPAQLRQVVLSLVMNAAEALAASGGEIVIRTRIEDLAEVRPGCFALAPDPGRHVVLEVTDTGPGMAEDVKARMFDPFFTTKFPGRGLGLSAVLGIVKGHGGGIAVASEPGRGTTVRVLWRVDSAGPVPEHPAPAANPTRTSQPAVDSPPRPVGMALVADDEMFIREVAASTLTELGYEPVLAGDGRAAVELFRRHRGAVRIAVVDVQMPGLNGEQVVAAVRELEPDLPVVLVSGYTDHNPAGRRITFLQKPFHPEDLVSAVQRVTGHD